jgi:hypothetical protein
VAAIDDDKIDLLAIHCAGGRLRNEPSRALPQEHYGDPAKHVRMEGETKCNECLYSRPGKLDVFCGKGRPYGKRCEFFRIKKK